MLALSGTGAKLDCLRPYLYPETAAEETLALDLVHGGGGFFRSTIEFNERFEVGRWLGEEAHQNPFLEVLARGLIGDLAGIFGLSMSRVAGLAIVAAISRSEEWVRRDVVSACQEEISSFRFLLRYHYGLDLTVVDEAAGR